MPRYPFSLAALLLCSTALAGCQTMSSLNPFGNSAASDKVVLEKQMKEAPPADLAGGVRQAHELRLAGKYDEASRVLSQLMLVASDDPRVVGEYGKTLLQRGRMQDAVQFLSRANQIQSGDWTTYSALGVAYDQLGDQASAKTAYDHALALAPKEPSVLSNYALSRLLANDVEGARVLAARAESAGGAVDPKIARNIAMIQATSPQPSAEPQPVASAAPTPKPGATAAPAPLVPQTVANAAPQPLPVPAPKVAAAAPQPNPVAAALAPAPKVNPQIAASGTPRPLLPATASNALPPGAQPWTSVGSGVVMQPVPVDPLAGPVKAAPIKLKPPVQAVASDMTVKVTPEKTLAVAPRPQQAAKDNAARPAADKVAAAAKPAVPVVEKTLVKPVAEKPAAPVKTAAVEKAPVPVKTAVAVSLPVKPDAVAPIAAKPVDKTPAPVKAATIPANGVPALRLASDASTP